MPRINFEDVWVIDPRRRVLEQLVGIATADGVAYQFWRLAQDFEGGIIPKDIYELSLHGQEFIKARLANEVEGGIYICGSNEHFQWLEQKREQARNAGRKSAEARKLKFGSAIPKKASNSPERKPNARSERSAERPNGTEPSYSSSYSKKKDIYKAEFLEFWKNYPNKKSKFQASKAWDKAKINGKAEEVLMALEKQKKTKQWQDEQYIPHAATWLNNRRWEDEEQEPLVFKEGTNDTNNR